MKDSYSTYESFFYENDKKCNRANMKCKQQQQDCLILERELTKLKDTKQTLKEQIAENEALCEKFLPNKEYLTKSLFVFLGDKYSRM